MKQIFLTGHKGFIGSYLFKKLLDLGYRVETDMRFLPYGKYEYVIHLAATTSLSTAFDPKLYYNNVVFGHHMLSTPFRTIYASSTSAYEANNPYAHTKLYNEHMGNRHPNALGLRFFNCYGPKNNKGIVKKVIDCCVNKEPLNLSGAERVRDFIFIDDVVDAIIRNLDNPEKKIDIGTGTGTQIKGVVHLIAHMMGHKLEVNITEPNNNEQEISIADTKHMQSGLLTLEQGMYRTLNI